MNAVEIEEAISALAERPFEAEEFPYAFLEAFGNKETTLKRLRKGESNKSDLGGVLQTNNIHIATCKAGEVTRTLAALKASPATARAKARFVLATDGDLFEAEDLTADDGPISCAYTDFPNHFGLFLPLAGITTVRQVRESSFDIRATSRLNRLYVELLKDNPEWGTAQRRHDMNHFMARLIFCFFAEDTEIFDGGGAFTSTIEKMSARDSSNTHEVISELFRAMNTKAEERASAGIPRWAYGFPYVNGGLFSGSADAPRFSRIARSYLLHIGGLDWKKINPDIFGSMIQAVADDDERGALGMHYTSVPNILKVLNPLFLDGLRQQLHEAHSNARMLFNLRKRMSKIRVFDPACGSGNFLVIAYKEMREIEAEINRRRDEPDRSTEIPLTNFRGIELRDFPAEIARLALIIAEYQCDVLYRGQKEALRDFLPLDAQNWITSGNALRLDWLSICPPTGAGVKHYADDLFHTPLDQAQIDFQNEGGETYVCGNPPFSGFNSQAPEQKSDLVSVLNFTKDHKYFDYVSGWFYKAALCLGAFEACAFVSTSSIVQGVQVPILWRPIFAMGIEIVFAHQSFIWANNAANNAGVACVIVGLSKNKWPKKHLFAEGLRKEASNINAYLLDAPNVFVDRSQSPISNIAPVATGNVAYDGGNLIISEAERSRYIERNPSTNNVIRRLTGSKEFIRGERRFCIWITNETILTDELRFVFADRFQRVAASRKSGGKIAKNYAHVPYRFYMTNESLGPQIVIPRVSSEKRAYIPAGFLEKDFVVSDSAQAIYEASLWLFGLVSSRLHLAWALAVSGKLEGRLRYSAIICYNTFPVPFLTSKNLDDLNKSAADILLAREAHFPATIADLYDPETMPEDLRAAHDRNDEVLERMYIGRRFKNDTERLEKLFDLYTKMSTNPARTKTHVEAST